MKRVVLVALVLMLCVGALADSGIDWTQYPDDELQSTIDDLTEMINEARAELDSRKVQTVVGIGISTQKLLDDFQAYRKTANLQQYSTFLLPSEKDASSVIVQISDYCWINIRQDNGQVAHMFMHYCVLDLLDAFDELGDRVVHLLVGFPLIHYLIAGMHDCCMVAPAEEGADLGK